MTTRPLSIPTDCCAGLGQRLDPDLFQALCDPVRLALVVRLAGAEALTVGEATECCDVHLSGVSRHLAILKRAGVVEAEKRGREVLYRLRAEELAESLRGVAEALDACREAVADA